MSCASQLGFPIIINVNAIKNGYKNLHHAALREHRTLMNISSTQVTFVQAGGSSTASIYFTTLRRWRIVKLSLFLSQAIQVYSPLMRVQIDGFCNGNITATSHY